MSTDVTTETKRHFCGYCRAYHPEDQMTKVQTKIGPRWRCKKSIKSSRQSAAQRDAFGKTVTAMNTKAEQDRLRNMTPMFGLQRLDLASTDR